MYLDFDNLFYAITMQTKTDKTLYLMSGANGGFNWTFDYEECIWFETENEANNFASDYFKNFNNWKIKEVYANI